MKKSNEKSKRIFKLLYESKLVEEFIASHPNHAANKALTFILKKLKKII